MSQNSNPDNSHDNNLWETVIGLEVHVQLNTKSKLFSTSPTTFGAEPNTQANEVDIALPGTLPVLNAEALRLATILGLGINARVNQKSVFARKNYFYPDSPKGYQITQADLPIVSHGFLDIKLENGETKRIAITRAHLEGDAGKSLHEKFSNQTGIDLNRSGIPLLEVVSEPEMSSAKEAVAYLKLLHTLVKYLGVSDGNMQEGSFRCDANVSVRKVGSKQLGTRTETKNINSFKFVEDAINYEVERQIEVLESGGKIIQETRLFNPDSGQTKSMRSKEDAADYRYFSDPDLLPVIISDEYIAAIKDDMPELPWTKAKRYQETLQLNETDATKIANDKDLGDYFEAVLKSNPTLPAKLIANWLSGHMMAALNSSDKTIAASPVNPEQFATLLTRINDNVISQSAAKTVFDVLWAESTNDIDNIIEDKNLAQVSDTAELETIIDEIIQNNPTQAAEFRAGKTKLIAFFVGQVMKATKGKANPEVVNALLKNQLS